MNEYVPDTPKIMHGLNIMKCRGQPQSVDAGSIEMELIIRARHNHPNYRIDNEKVSFKLEEDTRGTSYAAPLKPFQRCKDGCCAFFAITTQHAGDNNWNV